MPTASQPTGAHKTTRPRPALFRALGRDEPPRRIEVAGATFEQVDCLKHDSWAATALYAGSGGKVICKFNRRQSVLGLPMRWLGRRLALREARLLDRLADVPHIPRNCGPIATDGAVLPNAVGHWYVEGHPLGRQERVGDGFFAGLRLTLAEIHRRGIAYVDLHKRENIIVADDGSPCLIDYQICWSPPRGAVGRLWPYPAVLRMLQRMDDYHLAKHMIRLRPDLMPADQRDIDRLRPASIKVVRAIGNPLRFTRRRLLVALGIRKERGRAESEVAPEDAFRT